MDEPFTILTREDHSSPGPQTLFPTHLSLSSAKTADHDLQYIAQLRTLNPEFIVTAIPADNVNLLRFADAGHGSYLVDKEADSFASWRGYVGGRRRTEEGGLGEAVFFARYWFEWGGENFILYTINGRYQYVLKEPHPEEHILGPSAKTDALIKAAGDWMTSVLDIVWVYDGYWRQSRTLYEEVMKASWDNVILDEKMKKELTSVANKFFDSKKTYEELGVPWRRGVIFHGPPGNGKTISIRALMHELYTRKDKSGNPAPIPTLYVKSAPYTWDIGQVFDQARRQAPCMLILEDIETIVNSETRSYFLNELDGIENNDGLLVVGSTNYLERLDPGLTKRPSRFDRKYLFPLPNEHERILYCNFWRHKLRNKKSIAFPKKLCPAMAKVTPGFSFAFMQECFVASLLVLAREEEDEEEVMVEEGEDLEEDEEEVMVEEGEDLEDYRLWVVFREQADILRKEVDQKREEEEEQGKDVGLVFGGKQAQRPERGGRRGSRRGGALGAGLESGFEGGLSLGGGLAGGPAGGNKGTTFRTADGSVVPRPILSRMEDEEEQKKKKDGLPKLSNQKWEYVNSAAYELK